jgi:hypothetical protein
MKRMEGRTGITGIDIRERSEKEEVGRKKEEGRRKKKEERQSEESDPRRHVFVNREHPRPSGVRTGHPQYFD